MCSLDLIRFHRTVPPLMVCYLFFSSTHTASLAVSQLREDQLKLRLRAKSAHVRVRAPVTGTEEDEDMPLSPVDPLEPALLQNIYRVGGLEEYEGESGGDNRASNDEMVKEENGSNQVEEFLIVQGDLESDLSFQYGEDKSDLF